MQLNSAEAHETASLAVLMYAFGPMLEMIRKLNGVAQAEMGRRLGHASNGFVRQVLRGEKPVPIGDLEEWLAAAGPMGEEHREKLRATAIKECDMPLIVHLENNNLRMKEGAARSLTLLRSLASEFGEDPPHGLLEAIKGFEDLLGL